MVRVELDKADMQRIDFIMANLDKRLAKKTIKKVFRMGAKPLIRKAKSLAPVSNKKSFFTAHKNFSKGAESTKLNLHKPGELKRSIGAIPGKDGYSMYIGPRFGGTKINNAWYAHFVEFGTSGTGWGGGIEKQPFMRPAWDTENRAALNIISRELERVVSSYLEKNKP